ncbi:MAG: hypothetical protein PF572_04805 [Patescibacteria group bacterium]|jgi:hypothetical protein|nr:hypothetical protein [Patescibacteria group bacterium]
MKKISLFIVILSILFTGCSKQSVVIDNSSDGGKSNNQLEQNYDSKDKATSSQEVECSGWQSEVPETRGYSELLVVGDYEEIAGLKEYSDENISFMYPDNWSIEFRGDFNLNSHYTVRGEKGQDLSSLIIGSKEDFSDTYSQCFNGCYDGVPDGVCSPNCYLDCIFDYSNSKKDKILFGNYINFVHTGPMPGGGVSNIIFERIIKDKYFKIVYSADINQDFPGYMEIINKYGSGDEVSEEDLQAMTSIIDNFNNKILNIVNTLKVK